MAVLLDGTVPKQRQAYRVLSGEGERYLFGTQLAIVAAHRQSTGYLEAVTLQGAKGDRFPRHVHEQANEEIYVMDGRLELEIDGTVYVLTPGDYAHIPAGAPHSYRMLSHYTRFWSFTLNGEVAPIYSRLGQPFDKPIRPEKGEPVDIAAVIEQASDLDIRLAPPLAEAPQRNLAEGSVIPETNVPYVLDAGEGDHLLSGDTVHSILCSSKVSDGRYITLISEGPKGRPIGEHLHRQTDESFFCVQGEMTLWVDGNPLSLKPGDYVFVPAMTKHYFRLDSNFAKFVGVLSPGAFEHFFRILGDPYKYPIFPSVPNAYRFDRVLARIDEVDLQVFGPPPGAGA
jgi:quercetin 2,3-dioxygenase